VLQLCYSIEADDVVRSPFVFTEPLRDECSRGSTVCDLMILLQYACRHRHSVICLYIGEVISDPIAYSAANSKSDIKVQYVSCA
jgi:hypothetical protein